MQPTETAQGHLIWMDLATTDVGSALEFYRHVFGWDAVGRRAGGGRYVQLLRQGRPLASMYQLSGEQAAKGIFPHWTPYVAVEDLSDACGRVRQQGGRTPVSRFAVPDVADIALVQDVTGALLGLWQGCSTPAGGDEC